MRTIRWVGHPSPLDDPLIRKALESARLPLPLAHTMRRFEHNRRISVRPGGSIWTIGPEHGFSRTYTWGPWQFDVAMDDADAALLLSKPLDRYMVVDVTDGLAERVMTKNDWQILITAFQDERQRGQQPKVLVQA